MPRMVEIYECIYDMMHLCRIIKTRRTHHKLSPLSSCTIPKRAKKHLPSNKKGDETSSPQPSSNLKKNKNRSFSYDSQLKFISGIFHHFLRGKVSHSPGPPPTPAFPPRRIPARRARDWIPGGRAAASCGNPSPTFAVDLGSASMQGKRWEKLGRVFGMADQSELALCDLLQPIVYEWPSPEMVWPKHHLTCLEI